MPELTPQQLRTFLQLVQDTRRDILNTRGAYTPAPNAGVADPVALAQSFHAAEERARAREEQRKIYEQRVCDLSMKVQWTLENLHRLGVDVASIPRPELIEFLRGLDLENRDAGEIAAFDPDAEAHEVSGPVLQDAQPLDDHEHWPE